MANIRKMLKEMRDANPELKRMYEKDQEFRKARKDFHMSNGCDEETATLKSWNDYWKKAKELYGVDFSIANVSKEEW